MKQRIIARLALICVCTLFSHQAFATIEPLPIATDPRIQTVMYSPNEVIKFTGHYGYQSSIEFAPGEEILTISMGDSLSWMVNPLGKRLFLKPIEQDALTNMTLITNKRTYLFELHSREPEGIDDPNLVFVLRFLYPGEEQMTFSGITDSVPDPLEDEHPERFNFSYTITGSDEIAPIKIFDDGEFTFFEFRDKNAEVPAFFLVDSNGDEGLINFRTRGDYIVIERVAARFTLRHGSDIVCVYNERVIPHKE